METTLSPLLPFFSAARIRGEPLVLATLIRTAGSTYRKSGAQLLIADSGEYVGLLSGGCLEGDLREHARTVRETGRSRMVAYDMRTADDELWGLGAGCEGAMDILLQRMGPAEHWQPFAALVDLIQQGQRSIATMAIPKALPGQRDQAAPACWIWQLQRDQQNPVLHSGPANSTDSLADHDALQRQAQQQAQQLSHGDFGTPLAAQFPDFTLVSLPYAPPPSLLLLGAGPDAPPVALLAQFLGWKVAVYDHRPTLIDPARFPAGSRLASGAAQALRESFNPSTFDAAVVMSHQLNADREYLRALAAAPCHYVGLLGPAPRREKLLGELTAAESDCLRPNLHAPVGLDLGGRSPEAIALSIVAGIQAHLHARARHEILKR